MSVVAAAQSCSSFLPTRRGIASLSLPRANSLLIGIAPRLFKVSAMGLRPGGPSRFESSTLPPDHYATKRGLV